MDDRDDKKTVRAEASAIMRHAEVWTLKDLARETELMCIRSALEPSLETELSELSTDLVERVKQLELLLDANRTVRRRCQASLRAELRRKAG